MWKRLTERDTFPQMNFYIYFIMYKHFERRKTKCKLDNGKLKQKQQKPKEKVIARKTTNALFILLIK